MSANFKAALWIVIAMSMIASNDAILKLVGESLGVGQLLLIRGLFATTIFLALVWISKKPIFSPQVFDPLVLTRAGCDCMATVCFVLSLSALSIATVSTLVWTSPVFMTLASAWYLKEAVSPGRWLAVVIGFVGVMCVTNPFGDRFSLAMLLPLCTACFLVGRNIVTQKLDPGIDSVYAVLSTLILVTLVGTMFAVFDWQPVDSSSLILLLVAGLLLSFGFHFEIGAIRVGELSYLAPFFFINIPVAVIWGIVVWNDIPGRLTLLGILLIVGSGLHILIGFSNRRRTITAPRSH